MSSGPERSEGWNRLKGGRLRPSAMEAAVRQAVVAVSMAVAACAQAPARAEEAPATQQSAEAPPSGRYFDPAKSDNAALVLADKVVGAHGGLDAWAAVRYLVFTFRVEKDGKVVAERKHYWDRVGARHRVEGTTMDGQPFVVLTDLARNRGSAYIAGQRLKGEEAQKYLENGYALWVNDTYWLVMPFKLKDPGVVLSKADPERVGEITYDRFRVSFEGVGLTPKDLYWIYVNPETRRMDFWSFVLGGGSESPTLVEWSEWKPVGGVTLSTQRVVRGREQRIVFPDLESPADVPAALFESPDNVGAAAQTDSGSNAGSTETSTE